MQFRKKSNEELAQILAKIEKLGDAYGDNGQALADHMGESLLVFGGLANHGFTEDHLDHIINYCRSRVEYVLHLVEREEQEDAYQLARQTLRYYLKNSHLGNGSEVEL
ncbi:hypothetical protein [Rufibacter latericius]|uniref:Uncharacterized protein n=1 Tax=Rufibacter latericius TaxID=2487040 RepID=A0A3M9M8W4_9BACT|nr:hypothetical protein [Rufibacter latericius]RNI22020.1 hypothetical protein EFB08_23085 [Rufibacter latericius]